MHRGTILLLISLLLLVVPFAPPPRLLGGTIPCPQAGTTAAGILQSFVPTVFACPGLEAHGPLAAFTYDSCFCLLAPGFQMNFNASWSGSTNGSIILYTWNFGDGYTAQTTNPFIIHDYMSLGLNNSGWKATLTVKNSNGLTDTITQTVTPDAIPRFAIQPSSPMTGQQTTLNGSASQVYGNTNTTAVDVWNISDGTNSTGAVITHVFSTAGLYRVTLNFYNVYGTSQVSKTVLVVPDPPASSGGAGGGRRATPA